MAIGPQPLFFYGLALGTVVAIADLHAHAWIVERFTDAGHKRIVLAGFFARYAILGVVFFISTRSGLVSAIGTAIGYILPKIALHVALGIAPTIRRKLGKEPETHYEVDRIEKFFIKEPWLVLYRNGKIYKTHRRHRRVKVVGVGKEEGQEQGQGLDSGTSPE